MSRARALLVVVVLAGATACGSDQDPGFQAPTGDGGTRVTSQLLEPCPPGGPDESTPAAGCLDEDGAVVHRSG